MRCTFNMDNMELAYTEQLDGVCTEIESKLCETEDCNLEKLIVQYKHNLMLADQSFLVEVSIVDYSLWHDCTKKFKVALQNVFSCIIEDYYEKNKNNNYIVSLFKDVANTSLHDCYDKKSNYMTINFPEFFRNFQKAIRKTYSINKRKKTIQIYNHFLKQIQVVALMESLVELKSKIKVLQETLLSLEQTEQPLLRENNLYPIQNFEIINADLSNEKLMEIIKDYNDLPQNQKSEFLQIISQKSKT